MIQLLSNLASLWALQILYYRMSLLFLLYRSVHSLFEYMMILWSVMFEFITKPSEIFELHGIFFINIWSRHCCISCNRTFYRNFTIAWMLLKRLPCLMNTSTPTPFQSTLCGITIPRISIRIAQMNIEHIFLNLNICKVVIHW